MNTVSQQRLYLAGLIFHALLFVGWIWMTAQALDAGEGPVILALRLGGLAYFGWMSVRLWRKWRRRSEPEDPQAEPAD